MDLVSLLHVEKTRLRGDLIVPFQYLKGVYNKAEERLLQEHIVTRQGGMDSN